MDKNKFNDMMETMLVNDLMRVQWKIYEITKKYDEETTLENYQKKSIEILDKLSPIDRFKMRWYSERTNLILQGMVNM